VTAQEKQIKRLRFTGWIFILIGFFGTSILTAINTVLQKFSINLAGCQQNFNVNVSGFSFGIFGLFIICGLVLIMIEGLQALLSKSKWGRR
jgi:hypothetical protein